MRCELPQAFFMRVAMGLALREEFRDGRAIEFFDLLIAVNRAARGRARSAPTSRPWHIDIKEFLDLARTPATTFPPRQIAKGSCLNAALSTIQTRINEIVTFHYG